MYLSPCKQKDRLSCWVWPQIPTAWSLSSSCCWTPAHSWHDTAERRTLRQSYSRVRQSVYRDQEIPGNQSIWWALRWKPQSRKQSCNKNNGIKQLNQANGHVREGSRAERCAALPAQNIIWRHAFAWPDVLHNDHNGDVKGSHHTQSAATANTTIKWKRKNTFPCQNLFRERILYLAYFWKPISLGMDRGRMTRTAVTTMVNFRSAYQGPPESPSVWWATAAITETGNTQSLGGGKTQQITKSSVNEVQMTTCFKKPLKGRIPRRTSQAALHAEVWNKNVLKSVRVLGLHIVDDSRLLPRQVWAPYLKNWLSFVLHFCFLCIQRISSESFIGDCHCNAWPAPIILHLIRASRFLSLLMRPEPQCGHIKMTSSAPRRELRLLLTIILTMVMYFANKDAIVWD